MIHRCPRGHLGNEKGQEIRSVVVAEVRALEGWLPNNFQTNGDPESLC
jgi:hypothetical protein